MKVSDESTIVMNDAVGTKEPAAKTKSGKGFWKGVVVGGVPGILLGSVSSLFAGNVEDEELDLDGEVIEAVTVIEEPLDDPELIETIEEIPVVTDDMSFAEAFAAARAELGPGGAFVWHGNVYSTFYEEEWESMTDEQREAYFESLYEEPEVEVSEGNYHEVSDSEGEVVVLSEEVVETDDGGVVKITAVEVEGHYGEVYDYGNDGQPDALLVDMDDDGVADVAMIDEDGDGVITDEEVHYRDESDMLAMNDANPEDALYDGMPDYTNDADTSSFA